MVKMTLLYRQPASIDAFEAFYTSNLALLEKLPHVLRRQVNLVTGAPGGESEYYKAIELYFEDFERLEESLASSQGQEAGRHIMAHAAQLVTIFFAEVYEEAGGSTPPSEAPESAEA